MFVTALAALAGCTSLGEVPGEVASALATATPPRRATELELDAGGGIELTRVPVAQEGMPPRARHAALSIQPGGDAVEVAREEGPFGKGFRWKTRYGDEVRTVLVSEEGRVLHKTWEVPLAEAPEAVLHAAAAACPGEVRRVEASQGLEMGADWVVTVEGPDGLRRQWRGDVRGSGRAFVERGVRVMVESR